MHLEERLEVVTNSKAVGRRFNCAHRLQSIERIEMRRAREAK